MTPEVSSAPPVPVPLPPQLPARWHWARLKAALVLLSLAALVACCAQWLDLQWTPLASGQAMGSMRRFLAEFYPPDLSPAFAHKVVLGTWETLAMSALGTGLAAVAGVVLALPASRSGLLRQPARLALNGLRALPELVWATLLLVSAGLGPFAGTLALALHTTGVLGRLLAEALENTPPSPAQALRTHGATEVQVFLYASLPQVLPQAISYTLYRWENNIRAASVMGVVGAGGLGQLLAFHLGLFHMGKTATVLLAMMGLVTLVDSLSAWARRALTR